MQDNAIKSEYSEEFLKTTAQKGRDSLFFLTRAILGFDKMTKDIHRPIAKDLELLEDKYKRMLLMLPRDWYKTTLASISYSIWRAINNPEIRILLTQNTYTNACGKLSAIKQIFEKNELFRACYPEILPTSACTWSKESLCVNRKGNYPESTFEAAGTNTGTTSRHYDLIIEDDTVAPDFDNMSGMMMQPTRAEVEKAIGWHRLAHPLLIEPGESQILVVGTRWIEDDLLEWIMKNEEHYHVIQRAVREDDNGNPDKNGRIVWETTDDGKAKFNEQVLKQLEAALGPYMYATLYLNCPTAAGNMLFKPSWIHYYEQVSTRSLIVFTSVDLASAKAESSSDPDYTVILTVGVDPRRGLIYVLDYTRDRLNPGETIDAIFDHYRAHKPLKVIVESIGYQRTLCYWLEKRQEKLNIFFPIEEVKAYTQSKDGRIRGLQPYFANTRLFFKTEMTELENEITNFPYGAHDDIIDALSAQIPSWAEVIEEQTEVRGKDARTIEEVTARYFVEMIKGQKNDQKRRMSDIGLLEFADSSGLRKIQSHPFRYSRVSMS